LLQSIKHPVFGGVLVAHIFSFLCCGVFLCLFVFVLCVVCPVLQVSLGCPFLISPSVFFNVYNTCHPGVKYAFQRSSESNIATKYRERVHHSFQWAIQKTPRTIFLHGATNWRRIYNMIQCSYD
jgi:uncharacterized membrane protein YjgN (DUF898 family)